MSQVGFFGGTGGGGGGTVETLTANTGSATASGNNINILGVNNITTTASGSTMDISVTGTTNHAVQVGNASGSLTSIAVGTTGQVLTGVTGGNPVFASPASASISITGDTGGALTGSSFTFTGGTTGLTFNGAGTTETVAGTLVVSNGGTGATSLTAHSVILAQGTSAFTALGAATNGQLIIGSTGANPVLATLTAGTGVSITNGAGSITISTTGTTTINYTAVSSSPYVVQATDDFLGVNSSGGAITVELPNAPATGRVYTIKDSTGSAATHNITVTTVGGTVTIDGSTSFVMNTAYEAINVLFDGVSYQIY
jgi:hypothetical protein